MKLHLPKMLLAAVVMACSVAQAAVTTAESITVSGTTYTGTVKVMDASGDVTAENLTGADYVVITPNRTELTTNVLSTATDGKLPTIVIAQHTTSANGTAVTPGELFLNAWSTSSGIKLDNDFILGSCAHGDGALRLHEAGSKAKSIVLTGTITLAQNAEIGVSTGDYNYLEGAIQAEGKTLELNYVGNSATINLSGGGTIGTLTGNLNNIVFAATKSDGTTAAAGTSYTIGALTTTGTLAVEEGVTITLTGDSATTNVRTLLSMTGAGNLIVSSNTQEHGIGSAQSFTSQLTGKLTVNNGATLDLCKDGADNTFKNDSYNLMSFSSVELDNGTIEFRGNGSLKNLTVTSKGATINVKDVTDNGGKLTLAETTTVNGKLSLSSGGWKSIVQIDKLTGDSNGEINCAVGSDRKDSLTIKSFDGYAGKVTGASQTLNLGLEASDVLNLAAGSSVNFTGTINIKGQLQGNTSISGTTINVLDSASVAGTVAFGSSINLTGTLENTGSITLTGLNVAGITGLTALPHGEGEASYSDGANGYLPTQYYVVKNSDAGSLTANNMSGYTFAGAALSEDVGSFSQDSTGSLLLTLKGAGIYYVNEGEVVYNASDDSASTTTATGFILAEGSTLSIESGLAASVAEGITLTGDATIKVSNGVKMMHNDVVNTENGKASYEIDGATLSITKYSHVDGTSTANPETGISSISLSNGAVLSVDGAMTAIGTEDAKVAITMNDGTKIKLNNGNTWSPRNLWADILVNGTATIGGSSNGNNSALRGTITGNGTLALTQENSTNNYTVASTITDGTGEGDKLAVSVNLKEWDSTANEVTTHNYQVVNINGANTYSGGTTITSGEVNTGNESALGTGKVSMNGGKLTQSTALRISAMDYNSGTVNNNGQNLTVTGKLTAAADMSIEGAGATGIGSLDLSAGTTLSVAGSLTIGELLLDLSKYEDMAQTYTLVTTTGEGATVGLTTAYSTEYNGYTASVSGSGTDSLTLSFSEIVAPGGEFTTTVTGQGGFEDGMLTLNVAADLTGASQVLISGISDSIMADILGLSDLPENGMVGIILAGANRTTFTAEDDQQIGFQGKDGGIYFGENVDGNWVYQVAHIPEPATATLSLLALAGLAARRRRKA